MKLINFMGGRMINERTAEQEMEYLKELIAHEAAPRSPYSGRLRSVHLTGSFQPQRVYLTDTVHPERNGNYKVVSHWAIPNGYMICFDPANKDVNNFSVYKINNMSNLVRIKEKLPLLCTCKYCTAERDRVHAAIISDPAISYITDKVNPIIDGYYVTLGEWHKTSSAYKVVVPIGYRPEFEERIDGNYYRITKMGEEKKAEGVSEKKETSKPEGSNAAAAPQTEKRLTFSESLNRLTEDALNYEQARARVEYPLFGMRGFQDSFKSLGTISPIYGSGAMADSRPKMKNISIQEMDAGFMVTVGCQRMAVASIKDLLYYLEIYAQNPDGVERAYLEGKLMPGQRRNSPAGW